jgi:threonine synthase
VTATKALEFEFNTLACPSTGNLMGAVAAHGAKAGMKTLVFFPSDLERGKIVQASIYGATMVAVDGSYDQVNRLCSELADAYRWAFCNINMRPYYSEGSKSLAFEVTEQLGWTLPDHVVAPVASGSLVTKLHKGFGELQKVGLVAEGSVRISAAQAEGCAPVSEAFLAGREAVRPVREPKTIAKSLAIGNPADGYYVIRIVKDTGGSMTISSDEDIAAAMKLLAETEGIFTETAGGVTISSLKQLVASGVVQPDECVVAYITGNGLKTLEAVAPVARQPVHVDATIGSFESTLGLTPPSTPVGAAPALVE